MVTPTDAYSFYNRYASYHFSHPQLIERLRALDYKPKLNKTDSDAIPEEKPEDENASHSKQE